MRNELRISLPMKNITVLMLKFSNMYVWYYGSSFQSKSRFHAERSRDPS